MISAAIGDLSPVFTDLSVSLIFVSPGTSVAGASAEGVSGAGFSTVGFSGRAGNSLRGRCASSVGRISHGTLAGMESGAADLPWERHRYAGPLFCGVRRGVVERKFYSRKCGAAFAVDDGLRHSHLSDFSLFGSKRKQIEKTGKGDTLSSFSI